SVLVCKDSLDADTWSPMLKMFDKEKDFSFAELLQLSLQQSDNNSCDILFKRFGGPEKVEDYLHKIGFTNIHIRWTEHEIGMSPSRSADNNCTPKDLAYLFEWFYHHKERNEYLLFVWNTMASCHTGTERISSIIPKDAIFVHKTGTGFPSKDKRADRNDAGIIIMPDGSYQIIAIFAPQSMKENDLAIIGKRFIKRQ
ncbi:MAG: serine hydrolase, partial [Prevotella sp.]